MSIEDAKTGVLAPEAQGEEVAFDATLRPQRLQEFIGQESLKGSLEIFLKAAQGRQEALEHVLLAGPPGLGKTSLAHIIAREMGANIKITAGPALTKVADVAAIVTNLQAGDVLFIDEIHRLARAVEEVLYPAMEDYKLDLVVGQGPGARTLRIELPPFTLVGATTRVGMLGSPLRDRFGMTYRLSFYTNQEMERILERSAGLLNLSIDQASLALIASRCRRTPRVGNRLLKRIRDYAQVAGQHTIHPAVVEETLALLEIDTLGLDVVDRRVLTAMIEQFAGGPVGLQTLAAVTAEEEHTLEEVVEPFLLQSGLIKRTPRGRVVTPAAYQHLER